MRKALRLFWRIITSPFRLVRWLIRKIFSWLEGLFENISSFFAEEPEDEPLPDTFAKTIQNPAGLLEHLDALRKHLLRGVFALILTTTLSFIYVRQIMEWLASPLAEGLEALRAIEVTENIGTVMRVSLLSGFALAFPYIALELWLFIGPGVSRRSRLLGLLAIPVATLFFLTGMAFAYFNMLPVALDFLFNFMGLTTEARPASYFNFVTSIMFWIGVAFEFPLVIFILARLGLVKGKSLASQWRLALVIIAVLAAAITPTIDPVNMALVMGPMIVLFFLGVGLAFIARPGEA
ncbi:MAG TPA: twin-arginine translocase subunit TatC [Anaerolineales bacterium]|nr:twin-arginine translocase subunit TatC [Anaerolineales bacterium]